jgi:hypothetical protein
MEKKATQKYFYYTCAESCKQGRWWPGAKWAIAHGPQKIGPPEGLVMHYSLFQKKVCTAVCSQSHARDMLN